jgi:hypothetical protein
VLTEATKLLEYMPRVEKAEHDEARFGLPF